MSNETKPGYEKCNFPGCDKQLKLPPWKIEPGSIRCLDHTRGQNQMADMMVDVLQNKKMDPITENSEALKSKNFVVQMEAAEKIQAMIHDPTDCIVCKAQMNYMGTLGRTKWFKCQNCGIESYQD